MSALAGVPPHSYPIRDPIRHPMAAGREKVSKAQETQKSELLVMYTKSQSSGINAKGSQAMQACNKRALTHPYVAASRWACPSIIVLPPLWGGCWRTINVVLGTPILA